MPSLLERGLLLLGISSASLASPAVLPLNLDHCPALPEEIHGSALWDSLVTPHEGAADPRSRGKTKNVQLLL